MKIICDSREKWTQPNSKDNHIKRWFEINGIEYEVNALSVGDYMLDGQPNIVVDRKQNLDEVSTNLLNRNDSARFWREVRRSVELDIQLIVLVEYGGRIKTINDVATWKSRYSPVTGRRLLDEMIRVEMAYGVRWEFCSKKETGKRIIEILGGKQ